MAELDKSGELVVTKGSYIEKCDQEQDEYGIIFGMI